MFDQSGQKYLCGRSQSVLFHKNRTTTVEISIRTPKTDRCGPLAMARLAALRWYPKYTEVASRRRSACLTWLWQWSIKHGAIKLYGLSLPFQCWFSPGTFSESPVVASVVLILQRHTKWSKRKQPSECSIFDFLLESLWIVHVHVPKN